MSDTHRAIEAVWRIEPTRLIARLTRIVRDVGLAEDLAQDALVIALERWPESGIPNKPGAWLMATAFGIPRIRPDLLPRSHLIGRLEEATTREFVLVSTPAGFGKTTLITGIVLDVAGGSVLV
jgi:predicted RNA polymerase sigma factor